MTPQSLHEPLACVGGLKVWRFDLDRLASDEQLPALSADEQEIADAFVHAVHRRRYRRGRGLLRWVLAKYLDRSPENLPIVADHHGKPRLADDPTVQFNVSHADHVWYLVVARGAREVGIDVELQHDVPDALEMAASVFSPQEVEELRAAAPGERSERFLRCWTRKEALVKAIGIGLIADLTKYSVGTNEARVIVPLSDERACAVGSLGLHPGEHVAIATVGSAYQLSSLQQR